VASVRVRQATTPWRQQQRARAAWSSPIGETIVDCELRASSNPAQAWAAKPIILLPSLLTFLLFLGQNRRHIKHCWRLMIGDEHREQKCTKRHRVCKIWFRF
jgi:hypothetical protein